MPTLSDVLRGYTPPTESGLADPLKQHLKSLPQKFAQNQQAQMDLLGKAFPGNTYESMMTQGDPKAMAELAMQVPLTGMIMANNGKPLALYHGTKSDIEEFIPSKGGEYGGGIYFGETPEQASYFAKNAKGIEGENIILVNLDIKNPLNVTAYERDKARGKSIKQLEKKGYDGIVATGLTGEKQYIVFKPEQVISTITGKPITRKQAIEEQINKLKD